VYQTVGDTARCTVSIIRLYYIAGNSTNPDIDPLEVDLFYSAAHFITMARLFSPCTLLRDQLTENRDGNRRHGLPDYMVETVKDLLLYISTEEFLSAERAFVRRLGRDDRRRKYSCVVDTQYSCHAHRWGRGVRLGPAG
jgi:hypothetical protein